MATQDGALITEFVTSAREEVASIPADPIRLAVSGGETVNQVLTVAPIAQQLSSSGSGVSAQSGDDVESEDNGFRVAGAIADDGDSVAALAGAASVQFNPTLAVAINPGDPGFQEVTFVGGGGFIADTFQPNAGAQNVVDDAGVGGVLTAEVLPSAEVFQTGIDGALSFNPVATPAAASAAVNTVSFRSGSQ